MASTNRECPNCGIDTKIAPPDEKGIIHLECTNCGVLLYAVKFNGMLVWRNWNVDHVTRLKLEEKYGRGFI